MHATASRFASAQERPRERSGLVLSGGGARGAYEAGVLSYVLERVYPELGRQFEFDVVAGTSVGAIHAGYMAASAHLPPGARAKALCDIWSGMALDHVLRVSPLDVVAVPLRALGVEQLIRGGRESARELVGGLVDITPLERLVDRAVPWAGLRSNLEARRPGALCVSCTDIATGRITLFLDGPLADVRQWENDPYTAAVRTAIRSLHVRASAALPFFFPAVRIGDRWYLDGGLRLNTPLAPALRLGADRLLVVALRHAAAAAPIVTTAEAAISQPAFLLGKVLNILMLDQLEHEIDRMEMINALIDGATGTQGGACLAHLDAAARRRRGLAYRKVRHVAVRPSEDLAAIAAHAYEHRRGTSRSRGVLAFLLARTALLGVPENEADLLSYIYFDASFTAPIFELGREDARNRHDDLVALFAPAEADAAAGAACEPAAEAG